MRRRIAIILVVIGSVVTAIPGAAAASTVTTRQVGLAGYYFTVRKTAVLRLRGSIRVPSSTCGTRARRYELQIGAGFTSGKAYEDAIVILQLICRSGVQRTSGTELVAGHDASLRTRQVRPGQVVRIRVTVRRSRSWVKIIYPGRRSSSVSGPGGVPAGASYALTLRARSPAHYSTVRFFGCRVNNRRLSAFRPRRWTSVTRSHQVDGRVSKLRGTRFSISY